MTSERLAEVNEPSVAAPPSLPDRSSPPAPSPRRYMAIASALSFRNISAIYVFAVIFLVFAIWVPTTWLDGWTWKSMLTDEAETAMLAIGAVIPLAAGAFDLAIGSELGLGGVVVAWLLMDHHVAIVPAIVLTILIGALVGVISGLLIVKAKVDSFIATLGMSSVLLAVTDWVSNSQQITGLSTRFQDIAQDQILGIGLPVFMMVILALIVWYVLERTPVGRKVYAAGGNPDAARLAGVNVPLIIVCSLVACGMIAAISGLLISSSLGVGDPTIGTDYLLPAYTAAFLGSTQFRRGRMNVWGTVLAVYVIEAGVKGVQLAGAAVWFPDMLDGVALLLAVALAKYEVNSESTRAIRRLLRFDRQEKAEEAQKQ